jgi:hypothetical protein
MSPMLLSAQQIKELFGYGSRGGKKKNDNTPVQTGI